MTTEQLKAKLINDIYKQLYFDPTTLYAILVAMNERHRIRSKGAIIARFDIYPS